MQLGKKITDKCQFKDYPFLKRFIWFFYEINLYLFDFERM